jgi:predicted nucleotidyltransferase
MTASIHTYRKSFRERLQRDVQAREQVRRNLMQVVTACVPAICARYDSVQRAYLFGSLTQPGQFHAQSDVDVAIEGATAEHYFALWHALEEALPERVIDLRDVEPHSHFGRSVRLRGQLLYERTDSTATG